jgi:hypothetical protein
VPHALSGWSPRPNLIGTLVFEGPQVTSVLAPKIRVGGFGGNADQPSEER